LQISRRAILATPVLMLASPAEAAPATIWLAYERRLRDRLADAAGGRFDEGFEDDLRLQTNALRQARSLTPLIQDPGLVLAARAHAADMARTGLIDHATPEGFMAAARVGLLARDLVGAAGENIAMRRNASGPVRPEQIMAQWRGSPGHQANLLADGFTHVGYGVVRQGPKVLAVGAYAEVAARLRAPAPLRVASTDAIALALSKATPAIRQFSVSEPGREALIDSFVEGRAVGGLPAGAWQLRPHLSSGEHRYQVAWGPVFVLG
jgi:uncharacterized protein YkwD